MPRPSKFTTDVKEKLLNGRQIGATQEICADLAGIGGATLSRWLEKGRDADPDTAYGKFYREWMEASAHPKVRALDIIYREMPNNPNLARWFVERQVKEFAPPQPNIPTPAPTQILIQLGLNDGRSAVPTRVIEGDADVPDLSALPAPTD